MSRAFLFYSVHRPSTFQYVGSAQFVTRDVAIGDVVWICRIEKKRLLLVGRVAVAMLANIHAVRAFIAAEPAYDAPIYALADAAEATRRIDLTPRLSKLSFIGQVDKVAVDGDGGFGTMQFRTMRELTPVTARLLNELWKATPDHATDKP